MGNEKSDTTGNSELIETSDSGGGERDADFSKLNDGSLSAASDCGGEYGNSVENQDKEGLKRELAELSDKHLRSLADFENYKKRAQKERSELLKYQGERIFYDLLDVLDSFELALQYTRDESTAEEHRKLKEGIELIYKMLSGILTKWEVRAESGIGKEFDPAKFSAISKVQTSDEKSGTIVGELKKAYFYKDKMLRPGEVVVAEAPTQQVNGEVAES